MFEQITHDKTASWKKVQVGDNRGFGRVIIVYVKESTDKNLTMAQKSWKTIHVLTVIKFYY